MYARDEGSDLDGLEIHAVYPGRSVAFDFFINFSSSQSRSRRVVPVRSSSERRGNLSFLSSDSQRLMTSARTSRGQEMDGVNPKSLRERVERGP
jgi:hypothetical protein